MGAYFGYCEGCGQELRAAVKVCGECHIAARMAADFEKQIAPLVAALAMYADHDNWPHLQGEDDEDADPLWFDLQGEHIYQGWKPAEEALIAAGLLKRDGDDVREVTPGAVWAIGTRYPTVKTGDQAAASKGQPSEPSN